MVLISLKLAREKKKTIGANQITFADCIIEKQLIQRIKRNKSVWTSWNEEQEQSASTALL